MQLTLDDVVPSTSASELWAGTRLKHVTTHIGSGKTPSGGSSAYKGSGIPLLRSQNIHDDGLRTQDVVFIDENTDRAMRSSRTYPNDVLLNITGASLGRCALMCDTFTYANVNQHVCILRPHYDRLAPSFLRYALLSHRIRASIFASENGVSREGLNFQQIGNLSIPLPPLDEQRAIAAFLDRETAKIDELIAKKKRLIELLEERTRSRLAQLVSGGVADQSSVTNTSIPWLPEIPTTWRIVKL